MKVLAIERECHGTAAEQILPFLKQEAETVWEWVQAGIIREVYFHEEHSSAVLIMECDSKNHAAKVLNTLPLVQEELVEFDILPLVPYPGFARLFEKNLIPQKG